MKSRNVKLIALLVVVGGVVAWSPPTGEDITVGSGNTVSSPAGVLGVIGSDNNVKAKNSFVVGESNVVTPADNPYAWASIVAGTGNILSGGVYRTFVSGDSNTVQASNSLLAGAMNTLKGPGGSGNATGSLVVGGGNNVQTAHGWAAGYNNQITGDYSVSLGNSNTVSGSYGYALGAGLTVNQSNAVALGQYNGNMAPGDVLAVGSGTSTTANTALRVTSDGGVILGRAQGDISMGAYQ